LAAFLVKKAQIKINSFNNSIDYLLDKSSKIKKNKEEKLISNLKHKDILFYTKKKDTTKSNLIYNVDIDID
jgi:hypothetical protein